MTQADNKAITIAGRSGESNLAFLPTEENIKLLKDTLAGSKVVLTDNELGLLLYQANKTGLDPLARQIYALKTTDRLSLMTSIDGQRLVAQRTGEYQGQVGPEWCGKDGKWVDVWLSDEKPAAARVGVQRAGFEKPLYGVATWRSYANEASHTWKKMGDVMLAKCAEALALRKAFPQELSGLYTSEEMDQAGAVDAPQAGLDTPPPAKNKMTVAEALGEIGRVLESKGFKRDVDRKTIIVNFAQVESMRELKANRLVEVLAFVKSETAETLATFLPKPAPIEGEIVNEKVDEIAE